MITVFNVKSNRTADIDIEPGTTVARLVAILAGSGYDVSEGCVVVNRFMEGDRLYGQVGSYALQDGDTVEISTRTMNVPGLLKEAQEVAERLEAEIAAKRMEHMREAECCTGRECRCQGQDDIIVRREPSGDVVIRVKRG